MNETANTTEAAAGVVESATGSTRSIFDLLPDTGLIGRIFTVDTAWKVLQVLLTIFIGLILVGLVISLLRRFTRKRFDARTGGLIIKIAQYLGITLIVINVFDVAQINLSALLGAAGIAGIALGFAAQTSVSNFISGVFLVSEKTFAQGDVLTVGDTTGIVYSIDAMSVKLRTFDNKLIRIPNETLIKTNVANITRFPVRRVNLKILVTYDTDLEKARAIMLDVAARNTDVLRNPEPVFMVNSYADSGIDLFFGVWCASSDWFQGLNSISIDIKKRFDAEGIEFAFPTRTIYTKKG
ncbi:MAG: mechanosensitive ion channel family protein [Clostridia bacterium]|jgi:small-conductance mechanosensitive channel